MRLLALTRRYYAVLAQVSLGYPPLKGRLVTCYSPVRHFTQGRSPFLVRLACVRHAASVDSEPGSNSRLILVCSEPQDGGPRTHERLHSLERSGGYNCVRMTQPNIRVISRLARSTMLSKILTASALAGSFGSRTQEGKATSMCPRTCCAVCTGRALATLVVAFRPRRSVLRDSPRIPNLASSCQPRPALADFAAEASRSASIPARACERKLFCFGATDARRPIRNHVNQTA